MEEGNFDGASQEKQRLEEKQRRIRKEKEHAGVEHKPRYFDQTLDPHSGEQLYVFNNKYWELRQKMDYADMPDLF